MARANALAILQWLTVNTGQIGANSSMANALGAPYPISISERYAEVATITGVSSVRGSTCVLNYTHHAGYLNHCTIWGINEGSIAQSFNIDVFTLCKA